MDTQPPGIMRHQAGIGFRWAVPARLKVLYHRVGVECGAPHPLHSYIE